MTELEQIERDYARRERNTAWITNTLLGVAVACLIPIAIVAWGYNDHLAVRAKAEDDCAYYYGSMTLDEVEPNEDGVTCFYRGM